MYEQDKNTHQANDITQVPQGGFLSDDQLEHLSTLLDSRFAIPATTFRIGLDGIIGLVPVVGDMITTALSLGIVAEGWKRGVRKRTIAQMLTNTGVDFLIGSVPLVGDIFDVAYSANVKNIALIRADAARKTME